MATNLHIDAKLLAKAVKVGGHKTKRAAVEAALNEYAQFLKRRQLMEMAGTIEYLPGQDPLSRRRRARGEVVRKRRGAA